MFSSAISRSPRACLVAAARGSARTIEALRREIGARGLGDDVQITVCGSLGLCEHGPNLIVYPEGVWYSGVTPEDVPEIVASHFENDTPVERAGAHGWRVAAGRDPGQPREDVRGAARPGRPRERCRRTWPSVCARSRKAA